MKKLAILLLFSLCLGSITKSQDKEKKLTKEERLAWFKDAKLGIFIHWGIYGVKGISESWSMYHQRISYKDYMSQMQGFTASNYQPEKWAKLFKETGARYVVMTSKHHDGFALWDTKYSSLNAKDMTPAARDVYTPYVTALRNENLKVGIYFSLCDWSHPDYAVPFPRPETLKYYPQKGLENWDKWNRFVAFYKGQLKELTKRYQPDLFWFDGDWEQSAERWRAATLKDSLLAWQPKVVVNSRLKQYGDYATPEQGIPVARPDGAWEFCMTMNDHWGYYPTDTNYKPISQIIRTFVEVIANGGNLLLNIGPKPDGSLAPEQQERLEALGKWIRKHHEAVFDTNEGLPSGHFYGPTLVGKDGKSLYLCLFDEPKSYILLKGLQTKVSSIEVVGSNEKLSFVRNGGAAWNNIPGILRISIPSKESQDKYVTIVKLNLEKKLQLYRGHGNAVELNE